MCKRLERTASLWTNHARGFHPLQRSTRVIFRISSVRGTARTEPGQSRCSTKKYGCSTSR
jgi:hypothetical protein